MTCTYITGFIMVCAFCIGLETALERIRKAQDTTNTRLLLIINELKRTNDLKEREIERRY